MAVKPFSLKQAQELLDWSINSSAKRFVWWRTLERLYRTGQIGTGAGGLLTEDDLVGTVWQNLTIDDLEAVNLVLPRLNLLISQSVSRDPRPFAEPWSGDDADELSAKIAEIIGSYFWKRTDSTSILRDATQDMVNLGNGFMKVTWNHAEEEQPRSQEDITAHLTAAHELASRTALANGETPPSVEDVSKYISATEMIVAADEPFVSYVSPYDIFFPHKARTLKESLWVAHRMIVPKDELIANPSFSNTDQLSTISLTPDQNNGYNSWLNDDTGAYGIDAGDPTERCEIFEFYDMRTHTMLVFQRGAENALYEGELPYSHRYTPFIHLINYHDGGSELYGFGDLENIAGLQGKINEIYNIVTDRFRSSGTKFLTWDDITEDQEAALMSDEDGLIVKFKRNSQTNNLQDMVHQLDRSPLGGDVLNAQSYLREAFDQVAATNEFQSGGMGPDRASAAAANAAMSVAEVRSGDKQMSVESAAGQVLTLLVLLCQEFLTEEKLVAITGPKGRNWLSVMGSDIKGEFKMQVSTGTLKSINPIQQKQDGIMILSQVLPGLSNLGTGDPTIQAYIKPILDHALALIGIDPTQFPTPQAPAQPDPDDSGPAPKQPSETLNYKDAPPDIRRQIEAQAGLQPSTMEVAPAPAPTDTGAPALPVDPSAQAAPTGAPEPAKSDLLAALGQMPPSPTPDQGPVTP